MAKAGSLTWKTDVWGKAKVASGKTVGEKQETSYLSDLLGRVKKSSPEQSAHMRLVQH